MRGQTLAHREPLRRWQHDQGEMKSEHCKDVSNLVLLISETILVIRKVTWNSLDIGVNISKADSLFGSILKKK